MSPNHLLTVLGYNRVLTLYDGMRVETQQWGDEHGVPVDDYIIERAEIIKGPASLMYGSDAIAGVLSLFPFIPYVQDEKLHVRFLSEYQTNNGLIGNSLMLSGCGAHWSWAARVLNGSPGTTATPLMDGFTLQDLRWRMLRDFWAITLKKGIHA